MKPLRYLSVCSGIEAATCAWHTLGWEPAAFSEIEAFPSAVLAHHYPAVPNLGDMTKFDDWSFDAIDLLVGGTPCQSFSVAGLRKGLADPRGNLMLTYGAIAAKHRPKWLVWENVPGVLSSNGGRDFGTFLWMLGELGYGFAYRVLDAQFFGVAQRRRRVFVVGYLGDWRRAAAVLFERHCLQGHPAPSRQAREGTARAVAPSLDASFGRLQGCSGQDANHGHGHLVAFGGNNTAGPIDVATACNACASASGRMDFESETFVTHPYTLAIRGRGDSHNLEYRQDGTANALLTPNGGRGGIGVGAVAFDTTQVTSPANRSNPKPGDPCHPLAAGAHAPAVAFDCIASGRNGFGVGDVSGGLRVGTGGSGTAHAAVQTGMQVRRLTPRECSRLQGFPDDYLELHYANADEAHAAQVLHQLWREAGEKTIEEQRWRVGISASLLTPEILLAGVHGGWLSWEMAARCAATRGPLPGEKHNHEGFVRALREAGEARHSPFGRESFEQCAQELGSDLSLLPLEGTQARKALRDTRLWPQAQARWPLRYALAKSKAHQDPCRLNPDGPRYKALGNSMAVPCMAWIGRRIQSVEALP